MNLSNLEKHFDLYYNHFTRIAQKRFINVDTSHRCLLECAYCIRQDPRDGKNFVKQAGKEYGDLTEDDARIMGNSFKKIFLCGQISDPIYHKNLLGIIEVLNETTFQHLEIHTNGSGKKKQWWQKLCHLLLQGNYTSNIIFGIDGVGKSCSIHRKNQDWDSACAAMDYCATVANNKLKVSWQYIPFEYNENDVVVAAEYALDKNIEFILHRSSRFGSHFGHHVAPPKNPYHLSGTGFASSLVIDNIEEYKKERDKYAA